MIYFDSSALLKLLLDEPQSAALEEWVSTRAGSPKVSSELAKIEVIRACRRLNPDALPEARALLAALDLVALTRELVDDATEVGGSTLRALDAIHLASAMSISADLSAFVVYDRRLAEAASTVGLETFRPGS